MKVLISQKRKIAFVALGLTLFSLVYFFPIGVLKGLNGDMRAALGILLLAATLWITESIPLYTTSLLIVLFQVIFISEKTIGAEEALLPFFSPIIALFLGGFVLAAALHKYGIDLKIANAILESAGKSPKRVMLALMVTTAFLSMWMSNTATAALMIALSLPIYHQIPKEEKFKKALILGIPFAANIGGMSTPIGTPPNAIIIDELSNFGFTLGFLDWMIIALPLTMIMLLFAYVLLYFSFKPISKELKIEVEEVSKDGFSKNQRFVLLIFLLTVLLWLGSSVKVIGDIFQHPGIIALIPPIAFFGTGVLGKDELVELNWDVLLLMGGGLSLGNAISSTGLDRWIVGLFEHDTLSLVLVIFVFTTLAVVLSTFMSNTATAALMAPIMIVIGMDLGSGISVMASIALGSSLAMALPVSTPPNAIAYGTDEIEVKDMIKYGSIISAVGILLITLVFGYGLYIL
ncbi:MAG: SLC13 family permease [Thermoplasmatota archaeon]